MEPGHGGTAGESWKHGEDIGKARVQPKAESGVARASDPVGVTQGYPKASGQRGRIGSQ